MKDIKQLKASDVPVIREEILESQNGYCALCKEEITESTGISLDHQHKKASETNGVDGAGLVRGVLCRACNVWEGKVWNNTQRYLMPENVADRIGMLKFLIEYYEKENHPYIHPSEKPKESKISKRNYNRLKKAYNIEGRRKKFPDYPKSGKLTLVFQALFKEFGIEPYN